MATTLKFIGSKISPSDENGVIMLNCVYSAGDNTIMVSVPNNNWSDTRVLFNNVEVNMAGEYPADINRVIRAANKLFPNWKV